MVYLALHATKLENLNVKLYSFLCAVAVYVTASSRSAGRRVGEAVKLAERLLASRPRSSR